VLAVTTALALTTTSRAMAVGLPEPSPPSQPPSAQPLLQDFVIDGVTVFGRSEVLKWLRLEVGKPLAESPDELARDLERHYRREGFTAAVVTARFEEATGRLIVAADEGRIDAVEFEGVDEAAARRLVAEFEVKPGDLFNLRDARHALDRLLEHARGAIEPDRDAAVAGQAFSSTRDLADRGAADPIQLRVDKGRRTVVVHLKPRAGRVKIGAGTASREDWFSPVDGFAPTVSFEATLFDQRRFDHTLISGSASYKFARDEPGYTLGLERPILSRPKLFAGGELFDLTATDDGWRLSVLEQSLVALAFKDTFRDYYRRRGHQLHVALRPRPSHEIIAAWRDERHEPLVNATDYSFFRDDHVFRPNRPGASGDLRAVLLGYSWDSTGWDAESLGETYRRHQLDSLYGAFAGHDHGWRVDWTSELATEGLGGQFDYTRHIGHVRARAEVSPRQTVAARLITGLSSGTLPPERQFALGGLGSVRGYSFKESVGERMALVNLEYWAALTRAGRLRGGVFFDAGRVFEPIGDAPGGWLRGIGLGLGFGRDFRLDFGWRLDDIPDSLQLTVRLRRPF
jgi:hypothetical protein